MTASALGLRATVPGLAAHRIAAHRIAALGVAALGIAICAGDLLAQERFELLAPQLGAASQATLSDRKLQITGSDGSVTDYIRDLRFDSEAGEWLGFYSRGANQVLRWPASNTGNLQIGEPSGSSVRYRYSQMSIRPTGQLPPRTAQRPVLPSPQGNTESPQVLPLAPGFADARTSDYFDQLIAPDAGHGGVEPQLLRLAAYEDANRPLLLSRPDGLMLGTTYTLSQAAAWWVASAGAGLVRIQTYDNGRVYAVSSQAGGQVSLRPLMQDPRQLWRVSGAGHIDHRYILESAHAPGTCLSSLGGGLLAVQPIRFAPTQLWVPLVAPPVASFQPFYRTVSVEAHANPGLPPAELELFNSHRRALLVLLGDRRAGNRVEQIRIEPNASAVVILERDAGATLIETSEILSPLGVWERQQFVTAIPPAAWYDLSIYEEHLQSIAIDRTGKSPNPIEDINYVPKSVGWVPLPAGAALPASSRLDVYPLAKASNNAGAVRRLDPKVFEAPQVDRLDAVLQEVQPPPRRQF